MNMRKVGTVLQSRKRLATHENPMKSMGRAIHYANKAQPKAERLAVWFRILQIRQLAVAPFSVWHPVCAVRVLCNTVLCLTVRQKEHAPNLLKLPPILACHQLALFGKLYRLFRPKPLKTPKVGFACKSLNILLFSALGAAMSESKSQAQGVVFDFGTSPHGLSAELRRTHQETRSAERLPSLEDGFGGGRSRGWRRVSASRCGRPAVHPDGRPALQPGVCGAVPHHHAGRQRRGRRTGGTEGHPAAD